jgi:hypothetical protein
VHELGPMGQTVRDALTQIVELRRRAPRLDDRDRGLT